MIKEVYDLVNKEAFGFGQWFTRVVSHPRRVGDYAAGHGRDPAAKRVPAFLLSCIICGAGLGLLIPNRPPIHDRMLIAFSVSAIWLFLSIIVHGICRALGGKGAYMATISAMLQLLAVIYVMSNFVTFLIVLLMKAYGAIGAKLASTSLYSTPGAILFSTQFLLILVYVPFALQGVHDL